MVYILSPAKYNELNIEALFWIPLQTPDTRYLSSEDGGWIIIVTVPSSFSILLNSCLGDSLYWSSAIYAELFMFSPFIVKSLHRTLTYLRLPFQNIHMTCRPINIIINFL